MSVWVGFVKARLGEDEQKARAASGGPWRYNERKYHHLPGTSLRSEAVFAGPAGPDALCVATTGDYDDPQSMRDADHIARHDSARVLREVAAKRRILEDHTDENTNGGPHCHWHGVDNCPTVRDLAVRWADHEDYPGLCRARATFWPDDEACEAVCSLPTHTTGPHRDKVLGEWSDDELLTIYPDE